ncbi:hypothetical protein ABW19_dt0205815 [Dactylella cylindrospora]|nr:hypothetical protein ABW19_dt0205815 [Dactylella cylindrospora]
MKFQQWGIDIRAAIVGSVPGLPDFLLEESIRVKISRSSLDEHQKQAVTHCLSSNLPSGIGLLVGGPGTGKTKTLARIIRAASRLRRLSPVIVCAAADEALFKILRETSKTNKVDNLNDIALVQSEYAATRYHSQERYHWLKSYTHQRPGHSWDDDAILFCTIDTAKEFNIPAKFKPKTLVVYEASWCTEAKVWLPVTRYIGSLNRIILCGDPLKGRPYSDCGNPVIKQSLLARLTALDWPRATLKVNYRLSPPIAGFLRKTFYLPREFSIGGRALSFIDNPSTSDRESDKVLMAKLRLLFGPTAGHLIWVNVPGGYQKIGQTFQNLIEALVVSDVVCQMAKRGVSLGDIAALTPYIGQEVALRVVLEESDHDVEVATIEGFHGKPAPCLLLSLVRSGEEEEEVG